MLKNYYLPGVTPGSFFERLPSFIAFVGISEDKKIILDFKKYPHLLIAGATGSGKSTALKTLIASLLINNFFSDLQFVFVDLKRVELSQFKMLPHTLKFCDNIDSSRKVLEKLLNIIDYRYSVLQINNISNLQEKEELFFRIFVIIDEFSELILSDKSIEKLIVRISQIGRAAGVHLILCTQLPTAKILTNLINVNMSSKIALHVETAQNSRAILNQKGAELLGLNGDAILKQGIFLNRFKVYRTPPEDIKKVIDFWQNQEKGGLIKDF